MQGRDELMDRLLAQLAEAGATTLSGPGGIGKTRLATAVAEQWRRQGGSVRFETVSPKATVDSLVPAILNDAAKTLVILDAAEHAAGVVRVVVSRLVGTRVLVTSRGPLEIEGERVEHLRPLSEDDSLAVFLANVHSTADIDLRLARKVVRRLEGLPQALELAAARLDVLSLQELDQRLGDPLPLLHDPSRGPRSVLDRSIEASWDSLPTEAKRVLTDCAVFVRPFTLQAAEAVTANPHVLDPMHLLTRRCLLVTFGHPGGPVHFRLAPFIRSFLEVRHPTSEVVFARHASWFGARALQALLERHHGLGPGDRLEQEQASYEAVVQRGWQDGAIPSEAWSQCVAALSFRGCPASEAMARSALSRLQGRSAHPIATAKIHEALGSICARRGDLKGALGSLEQGLCWARQGQNQAVEARLLIAVGDSLAQLGHTTAARDTHRKSLALATQQPHGDISSRARLALTLTEDWGDPWRPHRSLSQLRMALTEAPAASPLRLTIRHRIAQLQLTLDQPDAALETVDAARQAHQGPGTPETQLTRGYALLALGRLAEAEQELRSRESASNGAGFAVQAAEATLARATVALHQQDPACTLRLLDTVAPQLRRPQRGWDHLTRAFWVLRAAAAAVQGDRAARDHALDQARDRCAANGLEPCGGSLLQLWPLLATTIARHRMLTSGKAIQQMTDHDQRAGALHQLHFRRCMLSGALRGWALQLQNRIQTLENAWVVLPRGAGFASPGHGLLPIHRRKAVASILEALTRARVENPAQVVSCTMLLAAGWPGERLVPSAARNRLHVALSTLRKLGLTILQRVDGGYRLDPNTAIRIAKPTLESKTRPPRRSFRDLYARSGDRNDAAAAPRRQRHQPTRAKPRPTSSVAPKRQRGISCSPSL